MKRLENEGYLRRVDGSEERERERERTGERERESEREKISKQRLIW